MNAGRHEPQGPSSDRFRDLGFGSVVATESQKRLLNRDGSFNVARHGLGFFASLNPYPTLLSMPWTHFLGFVTVVYLLVNLVFTIAYLACGPGALRDLQPDEALGPFARAFFFSVESFSTIGYGHVIPMGMAANVLITVESLTGLLIFALLAGLVFARFSHPKASIIFSETAIIAPYNGITAFEFRIANQHNSQITDLHANVLLTRIEQGNQGPVRRFYTLELERPSVALFPLSWTVVHPITSESPLYGLEARDLVESDAEFLVLLTGFGEVFSQKVHTRSSYKPDEIIWNARFSNLFLQRPSDGMMSIDVQKIHSTERL